MVKKASVLSIGIIIFILAISSIVTILTNEKADAAFLTSGVDDPFVVNNLTVQSNAVISGSVSAPTFIGNISGNASTASSLSANGANCPAGYYPLGVSATGAVESCTAVPSVSGLPSGSTGQTLRYNGSSWEGSSILYNNGTNIGIGDTTPTYKLDVAGTGRFTSTVYAPTFSGNLSGNATSATTASSATTANSLAANGSNCPAGYYPLGVSATGAAESCTAIPSSSDIYWSGTATGLNASTGRSSLGLGSLATLSSVTSSYISDGTIVDADISSSAAISASKIQYGSYFITSTGTSGQIWTSDGSGAGYWTSPSSGVGGSGSANYLSKWTGSTTQGNSIVYDNGTNVGIGITSPSNKLDVNGAASATGWYTSSDGRYKTDVVKLSNILPKLENIDAVSFNWDRASFPEKNFPTGRELGFIAQDVEKQFPEIVKTDSDGYKTLMYDRFSVILVEAIKEQQTEIDKLSKRIDYLEGQLQLTSK